MFWMDEPVAINVKDLRKKSLLKGFVW
jgi:hypothetical protein